MPYTLPSFNVNYRWWTGGNPTSNPPDLTGKCQLYVNNKPYVFNDYPAGQKDAEPSVLIRLEAGFWNAIAGPIVGSIFGIGDSFGNPWYYKAFWWEYIHRGFPNEYLEVVAFQCMPNGAVPDLGR